MLSNNYQSLEELHSLGSKCPRCSLCKFPPLAVVERKAHSAICPSYEEFKFHSSSGGGMVVMAMSLLEGRTQATEAVRAAVFGCTACGGCDMACKFSSDIEVLEIILQLRARLFRDLGPYPEHRAVLECIEQHDHPLPESTRSTADWLPAVNVSGLTGEAPVLLWVGPHYAHRAELWPTLSRAIRLLRAGGVRFRVLGAEEPYTGRAALEIGDRDLFARCSRRVARAIHDGKAREVVCLSAEDFATLRACTPRFAPIEVPVRHVTQVYADLLAQGKLRPLRRNDLNVAWHDSSYLGRLSEPYTAWQGVQHKILGQMIVTDPPRPLNTGSGGCYEPPRRVLDSIPGLARRELFRRREYAFDSGECGQAGTVFPEFALASARRRLEEAQDAGVDCLVTECPQSAAWLGRAADDSPDTAVRIALLTDLLADSAL